ncbi:hypothetical protein BKA62DRAFT_712118 [Auriculariales sp. MPI-PUGE-AT-0066]|nr:hypothetical protein BKA62DRAFT_712118 [Auriculariales sp. MPI-PUGE-AT-0066]
MKVSVRLDDISPLIQYDGEWATGNATIDSDGDKYSDGGTFKVTQSNEGKATIAWAGTQITVFGAKRFNHQEYTVTLDGGVPQEFSGQSDDPVFQTSLYQSPLVPNGQHQLVVQDSSTSADRPYLDIDFVVIDSEVDGDQSVDVEDDDPSWSFAPSNAWSNDPTQFALYSGGTGHSTRAASTAIDLYGLICAKCGGYWVSIDDGQKFPLNSRNDEWTKPKSLLFMGRGLSEGAHSLTVTNFGMKEAGLSIDYATVYGSKPRGIVGAVNPPPTGSATDSSKSNGTSTVAIILAVIIPLIIIILGLILVLLLRKRRMWPFNNPQSDEEMASPYPGPVDPRVLDIDGSPPPPMLAMPTAPASMYNAQVQDLEHSYAQQPLAQVGPTLYFPGTTSYQGSLPTYRESMYEQSVDMGTPPRPEKGRYRRF